LLVQSPLCGRLPERCDVLVRGILTACSGRAHLSEGAVRSASAAVAHVACEVRLAAVTRRAVTVGEAGLTKADLALAVSRVAGRGGIRQRGIWGGGLANPAVACVGLSASVPVVACRAVADRDMAACPVAQADVVRAGVVVVAGGGVAAAAALAD